MAAAWYRSKLFLILAGVLVVVLLVLLAAPYFLDIDRYRPTIVEQLEKATGRKVEIASLRLHFLPSVHIGVSDFRVKNPTDFPDGDTVAVEEIDIGLALGPLLRRQIEVTSVYLNTVEVNLLENEAGRTNYELAGSNTGRGKERGAGGDTAVPIGRIDTVGLDDVTIHSGSFWSRQKRVIPGWTASGIRLVVRGLDPSSPEPLKNVDTTIDLSSIEVSSPSLKEPLRFSDGEVEVKSGRADGKFTAALGKLRASGTVKVASLARPVADFTLAVKELNTAELAALAGGGASSLRPAGGGRGDLLARGSVQVDKLIAAPLVAQNVRGQARVYSNRLEIDPFTLTMFGGRTRGSLAVDMAQPSLPASLAAHVEGVDVPQVLATLDPSRKGNLRGTLEADASVNLPLGAADPLPALNGGGTFAVRNGTLPGVNVGGALAQMAKFLMVNVPQGDIRFSYFGGDFRIAGQRVHSQNLRLDAESLDADLRGSCGFDQTLDYTGTGLVKGQGSSQPTQQPQQSSRNPLGVFGRVLGQVTQQTVGHGRVPFTVRGTMKDPKFMVTGPPIPIR